MTAVFITVYRQRTLPKIIEEKSVQGQINQIIIIVCVRVRDREILGVVVKNSSCLYVVVDKKVCTRTYTNSNLY